MSQNLYELFQTDPEVEREGIEIEVPGGAIFRIAYAGGSNTKYLKAMEKVYRKHRKALETKTLPRDVSQRLSMELFVDYILLGWENVHGPDGEIKFTRDNAIKLLTDLPKVYQWLQEESENYERFLANQSEEDSGN